jgi:5'-3' exonuclease
MKVHLVDGTYELFRAYYAMPPSTAPDGRPVGAVRGLLTTLLLLLREDDVTHLACAFDHVVESFRNELFDGYKTGEGVSKDLMSQFELAERAAAALGVVVWPMVEFEADDAIATATARWAGLPGVEQVVICSTDKDLMQMVHDPGVVCLDRRRQIIYDVATVRDKFGIGPESIPDYLALVGDAADGIPGVPRWGAKSTGQVLARYIHFEDIPENPLLWDVKPRGAKSIAAMLQEHRQEAGLYKKLATLRLDVPLDEGLPDLEWQGVHREVYHQLCDDLGFTAIRDLPHRWAGE